AAPNAMPLPGFLQPAGVEAAPRMAIDQYAGGANEAIPGPASVGNAFQQMGQNIQNLFGGLLNGIKGLFGGNQQQPVWPQQQQPVWPQQQQPVWPQQQQPVWPQQQQPIWPIQQQQPMWPGQQPWQPQNNQGGILGKIMSVIGSLFQGIQNMAAQLGG